MNAAYKRLSSMIFFVTVNFNPSNYMLSCKKLNFIGFARFIPYFSFLETRMLIVLVSKKPNWNKKVIDI